MRSFESFKASRMKMDPSARKMSDYQWQQAYAAYKRVRGHRTETSQGSEDTSGSSPLPFVDQRVAILRQNTAYARVRKYVDWFFYASLVFIAVIFLFMIFAALNDSEIGIFVAMLPQLILWLGLAFVLRELAHVLIDIPDIALRKESEKELEEVLED